MDVISMAACGFGLGFVITAFACLLNSIYHMFKNIIMKEN